MRAEISLTVTPSDRRQLKALVRDHNAPQKHVWRAESVLLTARVSARTRIMRRTDKSKTCVAGRTPGLAFWARPPLPPQSRMRRWRHSLVIEKRNERACNIGGMGGRRTRESRTYRPSFGSVCVLPAKGSAAPAFASRMPGARTGQAFQARARRGSRPQPVPLHQPCRQRPLRA